MRPAVTIEPLPEGDNGTYVTLGYMADAVTGRLAPDFNGYQSEAVRGWAIKAVAGMPPGFEAETGALFRAVRDGIRYRRDPVNTERVQDALVTIQEGAGDCDDKVTLLATALAALGYTSRFVIQRQAGRDFDHVYLEAFDDKRGQWVPFDPTGDGHDGRPKVEPGWRNPAPSEQVYEIDFGNEATMNGITGLGNFLTDWDGREDAGIDWQEIINRGIDVVGARYGGGPNVYISPNDPRYRSTVAIGSGAPYGGYYPSQPGTDLAASREGVQLSTPLLLAIAAAGGLLLAGVLFGKGRR